MNSEKSLQSGEPPLQFDTLEYPEQPSAAGTCTCTFCAASITAQYWEVDGKLACQACCEKARAGASSGSGFGRFFRAVLFGLAAATVGSALWCAVSMLTGYELGIIALVVGLLVGGAVRVGCRRRGGWLYQALAMFLTYSAVIASYVPLAITEGHGQLAAESRSTSGAISNPPEQQAALSSDSSANLFVPWDEMGALGKTAMAVLWFVLLFVLWVPTAVSSSEFMGLLILAFALYEAWKMNGKVRAAISGPYDVAPAPAECHAGSGTQSAVLLPDEPPVGQGGTGRE